MQKEADIKAKAKAEAKGKTHLSKQIIDLAVEGAKLEGGDQPENGEQHQIVHPLDEADQELGGGLVNQVAGGSGTMLEVEMHQEGRHPGGGPSIGDPLPMESRD